MRLRRDLTGYGVAIFASLAATLLSDALEPVLVHSRGALFFAAVAVSAIYGGLGPGLLATFLSALGYQTDLTTLPYGPGFPFPPLIIPLVEFGGVSLLITYLSSHLRLAEQRAARSLALLDTFFSSAPIGFAFLDRDLRYVRVNEALAQMNGKPVSEHLGRHVGDVLPRTGPDVVPILEKVLATGEPIVDQELIIESGASGFRRYHTLSYYPVHLGRHEIQGIGAVVTEITDRKRVEAARDLLIREEAALSATEFERARLQAILERAPSGILFVDAQTDAVTANPVACRILGYPIVPEKGRAQYAGQLKSADGRLLSYSEFASTRALRGEVVEAEEIIVVQPNGTEIPVWLSSAPLRETTGEIVGAVVVFHDITAQKELEQRRREWISLIAHDLRQPVTTITGYASFLARDTDQLSPAGLGKVEHIRTSARNLNRMIVDLLDVSRIEANRLTLKRRPLDLTTFVEPIVERVATVTDGHPVRVEVDSPLPEVMADPGRIEQVLTNLLSNAAKYGEPGTPITVRIESRAAEAKISVTNHGAGISSDDLSRLFQRFYRTPEARDGRAAGLGLGLYITKGLVEAHGGRIWAESIPSETTTFVFTLPALVANTLSGQVLARQG
ncbi:MAG TPA: ATP-binding protein [Chloroflexota bacterium]|nr:ATP-binding protein [Chloroflexota bacterium]